LSTGVRCGFCAGASVSPGEGASSGASTRMADLPPSREQRRSGIPARASGTAITTVHPLRIDKIRAMSRWVLPLLISFAWLPGSGAQDKPPAQDPPQRELQKRPQPSGGVPPAGAKEQIPPEEDKSIAPIEYSFNPLQAEKDLKVGNYYWKQGKYRAAEARFREATRWNEGYGEAWLRLGEAAEKLKDSKEARAAYSKYLEVASDAKNAAEIRKKLEKLK
jgi:tetratricopeptide (TPR) repeat protein